jgi:hypothetical protein
MPGADRRMTAELGKSNRGERPAHRKFDRRLILANREGV